MTINCKGHLIDLSTPKVMGIVNITPDSFYDGGRYKNDTAIVKQVEKMLAEGASFIDMGGYSSRPGADNISVDEEKKRIVPAVELVLKEFPEALISVDTFRSEVAKGCLEAGAAMVNDISGGHLDPEMFKTVAEHQVPYIAMHMRGTPQNMALKTTYDDLLGEVRSYFSAIVAKSNALKINDLILDPGFGFSKTVAQNFYLLRNLAVFTHHRRPLLVGISRKSMIYKTLQTTADQSLNGTSCINTLALVKGANILRVHDVKEAVECIKLVQELKTAKC